MPLDKCCLPAYLDHDPVIWFRAVEANFVIHKVLKPEEKAALVVAALPEKQLKSVKHHLDVPEETYAAVKAKLISLDSPTLQESWEHALNLPVLQPGKWPSDVHWNLVSWLPDDKVDCPIVRATFLMKMPTDLKKMLLAYPKMSLEELAVFPPL